ncbi:MAG TPA: hypothetical protein VN725_08930 [Rhodanobacteraceae bacterium]|nr:hypothetical protein [Rhodanobacteraceae bacterium]
MTFLQADTPELDEVRQLHDAFMEQGRLELMAEGSYTQSDQGRMELLNLIERPLPELDSAFDLLDS